MKRFLLICFLIFGLSSSVSAISLIGSGISGGAACTTGNDTEPIEQSGYDTHSAYATNDVYECSKISFSAETDVTELSMVVCDSADEGNLIFSLWSHNAACDSGSGCPDSSLTSKSIAAASITNCDSATVQTATLDAVLENQAAGTYWVCVQEDGFYAKISYDSDGESGDNLWSSSSDGINWSTVGDNIEIGGSVNGCQ